MMNKKNVLVVVPAVAAALGLGASASQAVPSEPKTVQVDINGDQVTFFVHRDPSLAQNQEAPPQANNQQSTLASGYTTTSEDTSDDSYFKSELTVTFEEPIPIKDVVEFQRAAADKQEPSVAERQEGLEAARAAAANDSTSQGETEDGEYSTEGSESTPATTSSMLAGEPGFIHCRRGSREDATSHGKMYFSIYCDRTKPRIGWAHKIHSVYTQGRRNGSDHGMRWTYNGRSKPQGAFRQFNPRGYLTGTFRPISVGSEVTYGDKLTWQAKVTPIRYGDFSMRMSGVLYPV